VAIQNAPAFFGRGLTADEIRELVTQHPNIQLIKGEGPVVDIAGLIERTEGRFPFSTDVAAWSWSTTCARAAAA
jgi:dihydrodipicolinate synthase/N-acetylneuraminate lyase